MMLCKSNYVLLLNRFHWALLDCLITCILELIAVLRSKLVCYSKNSTVGTVFFFYFVWSNKMQRFSALSFFRYKVFPSGEPSRAKDRKVGVSFAEL